MALASGLDANNAAILVNSEAEDAGAGFLGWNYYDTGILTAAGEYKIWAVITNASADKAFKGSAGTVTISHRPNIQIDVPTAGASTTASDKFIMTEWTDVDYDQSTPINLFFGTTDLVGGATGGTLSATQVIQTATFTKFTTTSIAEDTDDATDRFLTDLSTLDDSLTYYIFGLIDADGDGTYEAGHQSGRLIVNHGSFISVTEPATDDFTTLSFTVNWNEQWGDNTNVPASVDLFFGSVKTRALADLDDTLGTGNTPTGIIEIDVPLSTDATTGEVLGTNTREWDDIVITSTTPADAAGGSTTVLIDTSPDSPLLTTLPAKYFVNRRLVITGGKLANTSFTIPDSNPLAQSITVSAAATVIFDEQSVTSYKIVIPDGTYYSVCRTDATLTDTANLYVGARVTMTGGATTGNIGQSHTIVTYNGTSILAVSPAFANAVANTDTYTIDVPETFSVSQGTVTITNHTVGLVSPATFHNVGDFFDIDQTLNTNGQTITAANIHIDFNATTLELANPIKPFSTLSSSGTTTSDGATSTFTTLIATALAGVDDLFNTD